MRTAIIVLLLLAIALTLISTWLGSLGHHWASVLGYISMIGIVFVAGMLTQLEWESKSDVQDVIVNPIKENEE